MIAVKDDGIYIYQVHEFLFHTVYSNILKQYITLHSNEYTIAFTSNITRRSFETNVTLQRVIYLQIHNPDAAYP